MSQVLNAQNLTRYYAVSRGAFRETSILKAVDGASFNLERGKTLAVVGESGCGKSTLARLVTMIELPTSGTLNIGGPQHCWCNPGNPEDSASQGADRLSEPLWLAQSPPENRCHS